MYKRNKKLKKPDAGTIFLERRSRKILWAVGILNTSLLILLALTIINPVSKTVQAAGAACPGLGELCNEDGTKADLNAGGDPVASSVSITMSGATNGQLNASSTDPNKSAGLVKRTASVEIGATDGYTVTLSGNPNLTGANSSNKIPTVTSNTTLAQMNNQWGWYTAEGNVDCSALQTMKQMKPTGDQIATGTLNAKTTKQFTMCFGAKVNGNQAADTYSNTVTLSVVAQPKVASTFSGITTMQEMTPSICAAAKMQDTAYLRDVRDGKYYWVTKLQDENCWMSQNLALNIVTNGSGTSLTSNINTTTSDIVPSDVNGGTNWGGNTSYPPQATSNGSTKQSRAGDLDDGIASSYNLGEYVLNTPASISDPCNYANSLSACSAQGFVNIDGWTASTDPNFYRRELYSGTDGKTCTKPANTSANTSATGSCKVYDAHYLVGNYYKWQTATAGTGSSTEAGSTEANATGSICPKGWRLPDANTYDRDSFSRLLSDHGLFTSITGNNSNGAYFNIALSPLFFVRAGEFHPNYGQLSDAGRNGAYWSSRYTGNANDVYAFRFGESVNPAGTYAYSYNLQVRCLVQASN